MVVSKDKKKGDLVDYLCYPLYEELATLTLLKDSAGMLIRHGGSFILKMNSVLWN